METKRFSPTTDLKSLLFGEKKYLGCGSEAEKALIKINNFYWSVCLQSFLIKKKVIFKAKTNDYLL